MKRIFKLALGTLGICLTVVSVVLVGYLASRRNLPSGDPAPKTHLRLCAKALQLYSGDHDDLMPNRDGWMDCIAPYLSSENSLRAPEIIAEGNPALYGYAFNSTLSNKGVWHDQDTTPLVYDSINLSRNASDPYLSLPYPGRHDGKDAVAYVDGHTKLVVPDFPHWP